LTFDLTIKPNTELVRGARIKISPIDEWCSFNKDEIEKIIDELNKIPN
jgi:hypothetical protein